MRYLLLLYDIFAPKNTVSALGLYDYCRKFYIQIILYKKKRRRIYDAFC